MIQLTKIAQYFENGLNELYANPEIRFHIWASSGEKDPPVRSGNSVLHFITGNLRVSSSSNDANILAMGMNGLTLDFSVPLKRPRTNANQSGKELQRVDNGQYPFFHEISEVIDEYFQIAQCFSLKDDDQKEYSMSCQAGVNIPGPSELSSVLGNSATVSVFITLYFIQGGTISRDITFSFDGERVPFQVSRIGRSNESMRDVYAGNLVSKSLSSSSAFSIDVDFPSNSDAASKQAVEFLLKGAPNTAHFVGVKWDNVSEDLFLMTFENVLGNAQGVSVAGLSVALTEVTEDVSALNFPESFSIRKFAFLDSKSTEVSFTIDTECELFIAGKAYKAGAGVLSVPLSPENFDYDESSDLYYVYLVTDKSGVSVSQSSAPLFGVNGARWLKGRYEWISAPDRPAWHKFTESVSFISGGTDFSDITLSSLSELLPFKILYSGDVEVFDSVSGWNETYTVLDFGEEKIVSKEFYDYFTANAKKV